MSIVLAAALAGAGIPAPAWAQAAASVAAGVSAAPSLGGAGLAGLAAGSLTRPAASAALSAGGMRFGLAPILPLLVQPRTVAGPGTAAAAPTAVIAEAARPGLPAAGRPGVRTEEGHGTAPTRKTGEAPPALAGAREIASRLGDAAQEPSPAEQAALLDRFFSGSQKTKEGEDASIVRSEDAWVPQGGFELPQEASDALHLAAFALADQETLAFLAREEVAPTPDPTGELLRRFAAGSGRKLSPERLQSLRALLTAPGPEGPSPIAALVQQAERTLTVRDLMSTLGEVRGLYARFFPAFYRALPMRMSFKPDAASGGSFQIPSEGPAEIALEGPDLPVPGRERSRVAPPFPGVPRMDSRLMRLVTAFHEYAHALFYERTGAKPDPANGFTAFDAVNEGFAVMLELLMIDKALAAREELGWSEADVQDLRTWKKGRLRMLHGRNHYTEGTLRFWHGIYRKGGEGAVLDTLDRLAPERLQGVPLGHPVFVLAGGESRLAEAFTRGAPLWEGWLALTNHVAAGSPLAAASRDAALSALGLIRPAALARFFEVLLNTRRPNVLNDFLMSPRPLATLQRLALLSPAAAERLVGFLLERLPRVRPSLVLARGPAWMEAFIQALAVLPMTDGQRAGLRGMVETWASDRISGEKQARARRAASAGLPLLIAGLGGSGLDAKAADKSRVAPVPVRPVRLSRSESGYVGPGSVVLRPYEGPRAKRAGTTLLNFPTFHRAPLDHPIETFGLYNCAALVISDRRQGRHFMAHITEDMPARVLENVLREEGISWPDAEVTILPGADVGTKRTVRHIRAALAGLDRAAAGRVRFVHFPVKPGDEANFSIISHAGKVAFAKTGRLGSFKLGGKYFQGVFPR